jgi:predicted dehydrogenase
MTKQKIRLGIIGANVGYGWTPRAHAPAIANLPDIELTAVCTAHEETARESAEKFGAKMAFHNHMEMLEKADLDVVAVVVRVPIHHQLAMDVLRAGKHVYTEWPLGANLQEAQEMADLARENGVLSMVGLQSRVAPVFLTLRDLIADGYVGDVLSVNLSQISSGVLTRVSGRTWQRDNTLGATTLTIPFGHSIDALCMCLGEFESVSATVRTQVPQWHETDTDKMVDVTAPDNIMVNGTLAGGAVVSAQSSSIPYHGSGWKLEVYGREGTLVVTSGGSPSTSGARLQGGKGDVSELEDIEIPARHTWVPDSVPLGAPFNIAQLWSRFADAIRSGERIEPDFDTAVQRHKLLDAILRSSDTGQAQAP